VTFSRRLKQALVGDTDARLVYLSNFEVEREWASGTPRLPGTGVTFTAATVNRMEEMGVFLADDEDVVLLKEPLDRGYHSYLNRLVGVAGHVLTPENSEPARRVTVDVLSSPGLLAQLRGLADGRTHLVPLGVSEDEELLARRTGLPLAAPSAAICKTVNSKVFGRSLVERTGLLPVPGASCAQVDEIAAAVARLLRPGGQVVIKEALGVSGRGMVVVDSAERAERFLRLMARKAGHVDVVVEEWIDKVEDLNYQFVLTRDGRVEFQTVKAAVVKSGVHRGHRFPVNLPAAVLGEIHRAAELIGKDLAGHGYFGTVGVDAMLTGDGVLYPCLEINARFNMATYQNCIADRALPPDASAEAGYVDLRLAAPISFAELTAPVADLMLAPGGTRGVVITNFATVNAESFGGKPFRGRLGVLCADRTAAGASALRAELTGRLAS
jgi:hypothetical protein